ncbi:MAG: hypothetical protein ACTSQY_07680 [Candidatus Odinarchaeia archaeon]
MVMAKNDQSTCPECNGHIVLLSGEYVCSSCGLVVDKFFEPPLSALNTDNKKSKGALGSRLHIVDGLGSYIDYHNSKNFHDKTGSILPLETQRLYKRLKYRYNLYGRIKDYQTDYRILRLLNQISAALDLPNYIRDTAAYNYRKIKQRYPHRIRNHITLIAVCLILAIREYKNVALHTLKEVCYAFRKLGHRVTERSILREALHLKIKLGYTVKPRRSEEYIQRILASLSNDHTLNQKIKTRLIDPKRYWNSLMQETLHLLKSVSSVERGGRNPYVFAAAAIYAADQKLAYEQQRKSVLTQKAIAKLANVAEYSIRDHYCSILKNLIK